MAFISTPSTSNNDDVSNVFGVSTANLSDATMYAFLANQPNGSQLMHEDLEQIHEDDMEETDLKWQLALLSMRAKRFFQKTAKKITINGSDTVGHDKAKVESFNCYKMGLGENTIRGTGWHMTGKISYLTDFKEFDGGYVVFGGGAKGGKVIGTRIIRTAGESHVLLKVSRKNNMYTVDMKNIIPTKDLTYLVAKATNNESMLCVRTLDNGEIELNAIVDGQDKTITEASVRRHHKLADPSDEAITKDMHDRLERATTTASSLEAKQGSGNISKTQTKATPSGPSSPRTSSEGGLGCHVTMGDSLVQDRTERLSNLPNEPPLGEANLDKKDSPKQGRMIEEINEDENINLVKSSKQGVAYETTGGRKESDDTKAVDFSTASPQKDDDVETLAETLVSIKKSAAKDKETNMLFDQTMESIRNFVPMESEDQIEDSKAGEGSSKEGDVGYCKIHKGDIKIMFEPDGDDEVQKNHHSQELIELKLYDSCGVYSLMLGEVSIHMLVDKNSSTSCEVFGISAACKDEFVGVGVVFAIVVDVVKDNKEPNKIKKKREAWKSSESSPIKSKPSQNQESIKKFKEELFTYCIENGILPDSSKPSNDNTNVVNALREPFVVEQDPGKNSSQSPPQINHHCCYGCGDPLEDIFFHQYTCELCWRGAHYGYNCPPKVPVVSNPKPCHNQTVDELPQTLSNFDQTCYSEDGNSFTYDSTSNLVHDSPKFLVIHQPIREKTCVELLAKEHEANIDTQPFQYSVVPQTPQEEMSVEFLQEKRNQMDSVKTFLRKFNRISFYKMPKVLSLAWETILEIELAFEDKHCQPEDILELFQRLHNDVQNIHEELVVYINTPNWDRPTICYDDDDEDYAIAKSSVESLVPILSESEGIPDNMCDVPFHDNSPPLDVLKDHFEDFSNSNNDSTSNDDDSFSIDNIEYVEASPPNSELVSSEVMKIVITEVRGIDDDILLIIKEDILREKLLNINLFITNIEALNDNPSPSSDLMTKSSSTSLNSLLEETNTFENSLSVFEIFCFDLEEISSDSTTTRSDISLPEYEAFYDDHSKEISSGSTTTYSDNL
uniref:Uncharacterized protein n=1 Tax=Tanacetum cinerariifolium TaxID=118510 RepID=A0A6L2KRH3_TANCI|nr:hypothetical protein [Tanacetum cinerariifolium]